MSETPEERVAKSGGKFILGLLVYLLTTGLVLAALGFLWGAQQFTDTGPLTDNKSVTIERGKGLNGIASLLEQKGAIDNRYIFILGARVLGAQSDLKAGEYALTAGISQRDIMQLMVDGKSVENYVTIPEGLTNFETIRFLKNTGYFNADLPIREELLKYEGTLFPNTYAYSPNKSVLNDFLVKALVSQMFSTVKELCKFDENGISLGEIEAFYTLPCETPYLKTVNDVLTLASIIEKETAVAAERRKVAGVFINRLKRGIPLQTDPTVIYAITKGEHKNDGKGPLGRRLLRKDLEYDSPYNTYKYPGLPPGPIANPGRASIEAALNPEEHDYIFFVADGTGGHAFAKTLAEHNRNVAEWRKIRRSQ